MRLIHVHTNVVKSQTKTDKSFFVGLVAGLYEGWSWAEEVDFIVAVSTAAEVIFGGRVCFIQEFKGDQIFEILYRL